MLLALRKMFSISLKRKIDLYARQPGGKFLSWESSPDWSESLTIIT